MMDGYQTKYLSDKSYRGGIEIFEDKVIISKYNISAEGVDCGYNDFVYINKEDFKQVILQLIKEDSVL